MKEDTETSSVEQEMQVNRDYDFSSRIPTDIPRYYPNDGEFEKVLADIGVHNETQGIASLPRYLFGGPTGCGKTHFARWLAQQLVYFQCPDCNRVFYENEAADKDIVEFETDSDGQIVREGEFGTDPVVESIGECTECETTPTVEQKKGVPLITVQCKYSMSEADLLGMPNIDANRTYWQDGPVTKALLASNEGPVVLLLDEVNRARPESKSVLFSALDSRAEVVIDGRGGELIQGTSHNLITISTINEGTGYYTEEMDLAERRRLGKKHNVDYLGTEHPEREVELIAERTEAHEPLAEMMVDAANDVRQNLASNDSSPVRIGIPTSLLLSWAQTAYAYHRNGISNPVMEAADDAVIRPFYGGSAGTRDSESTVRETIASHVDNVPFDEEEFREEFVDNLNEETDGDANEGNFDGQISGGSNMTVSEAVQALDNGADPSHLVKQGVDEDVVMTAMTESSAIST